jgi:hypothetical protein
MGNTAKARIVVDGHSFEGEALLETSEVILRIDRRRVIRFDQIRSVEARDGVLRLIHEGGVADIHLGALTDRWAEKIRNPKTVVQKLGVKAGQRVVLVRVENAQFVRDLEAAGAHVADALTETNVDAIFLGAETKSQLDALPELRAALAPDGALWVIRPKGVNAITENDVMAAGKAARLVDTKVVRFSATHTAEKFVIPIAQRVR